LERLIYDKRPFSAYIKDLILSDHIVLNIFYKISLFVPRYLRITLCFSILSFMFGTNALIYQDDDIKQRANLELDPDVNIYLHIIYIIFIKFRLQF